jgi:hypothetical protein
MLWVKKHRIPDPTVPVHKKRDEKLNQPFPCSLWFQEQVLLEKNKRTRILKKISPNNIPSGSGIRDPGAGKNSSRIRIQGAKSTGSRIRNTALKFKN